MKYEVKLKLILKSKLIQKSTSKLIFIMISKIFYIIILLLNVMMEGHKIGNACFKNKQNIEALFDRLPFDQCQNVVRFLEQEKLIINNKDSKIVHEFYVEMFQEMVSTEINQLYAYLCNTNILRLINHINFLNLSILNLNNCLIDNIESLCFINTVNLNYLYLYNNPVYRLKSLAKCFSTNGIKQLGVQQDPIFIMNQDQLLKKLKFSNIDIFNILIYQISVQDESYLGINVENIERYNQNNRVKYCYKIPFAYQLNFNYMYGSFKDKFYFRQQIRPEINRNQWDNFSDIQSD